MQIRHTVKFIFFIISMASPLLLMGCLGGPLLTEVSVSPTAITPNADGIEDVARISYHLNGSANLSIYFINEAGQRHYFRDNRRRSAGDYQVDFGGVVEGSMLPDGQYTWVVEAVDDSSQTVKEEGTLAVSQADTEKPELQGFSVYPHIFSPNQDGINDRVDINYYLTKEAEVLVYLIAPDEETRYPIAEVERDIKPGEPGFHTYDYEGGVDLGAEPPPDGLYTVYAEATDRVGNRTVVTNTLEIAEGGVPRADIVSAIVDFYNPATGDKVVPLGQTLAFTLTVENFGSVPIRTNGPSSGVGYRSDENFNTKDFFTSSGTWRVGIDYEGNPSYAYPYRWAVGNLDELEQRVINNNIEYYLMPGQRALVTGSIQLLDVPADKDTVEFWAGLIHEDVRIDTFNDHVSPTPIIIGF
ncbi:MAG: gliding motility-associated C-terminal domain-containing protein [Anaerolineaceae bacterium]|nr:gliding motility-associated C-terminal domain-containing protein [Anaerolineaceae bacterium]MCB9098335.1 gliding motility-associated C-terminal domain-containing protein [Anaerolineales bacterium]